MATGKEWSCPICCDAPDDIAYAMPCSHRFCLGCILRWAGRNPTCPLCRRSILTVKFSDYGGDNYYVITPRRVSPEMSSQAAEAPSGLDESRAPGPADSIASSPQGVTDPGQQYTAEPEAVGGIVPRLWAEIFRRQRNLLEPVRPWLRQWLEMIYGGGWHQVKSVESIIIMFAFCVYGPDRAILVQRLQPCLQQYTALLVHGILNIIVTQCSEEVRRLQHSHFAREEDETLAASSDPPASQGSPSPSQALSNGITDFTTEEEASTSETTLHGHPSHSPSVYIPTEQEQPHEELGETRVAAGSSAPGQDMTPHL